MNKIPAILGWYGVIAILLAYALSSFSILSNQSFLYHTLNGTGALGIVIDTYKDRDFQPMTLNIVWAIIALVSIVKILYN
jgi:hypothetical protein